MLGNLSYSIQTGRGEELAELINSGLRVASQIFFILCPCVCVEKKPLTRNKLD